MHLFILTLSGTTVALTKSSAQLFKQCTSLVIKVNQICSWMVTIYIKKIQNYNKSKLPPQNCIASKNYFLHWVDKKQIISKSDFCIIIYQLVPSTASQFLPQHLLLIAVKHIVHIS